MVTSPHFQHTLGGVSSCAFVLTVSVPAAQANGLRVEIAWDTATDMVRWWSYSDALFDWTPLTSCAWHRPIPCELGSHRLLTDVFGPISFTHHTPSS